MKALVLTRGFKTKVERLSNGLLIQLNADKNTLEQNRYQIRNILHKEGCLNHLNFLVACADTVFVDPEGLRKLRVIGNPHIAVGCFDNNFQLIKDAYLSKGMKLSTQKTDSNYRGFKLVDQNFCSKSAYHTAYTTDRHFFATANAVATRSSNEIDQDYETEIIKAGGGFYLLLIKNGPSLEEFKRNIVDYQSKHDFYDRMNDSCAHAVLKSMKIAIPDVYGLNTQTALSLVMQYYHMGKPAILKNCLKDPMELGFTKSLWLQSKYRILPADAFEELVKNLA